LGDLQYPRFAPTARAQVQDFVQQPLAQAQKAVPEQAPGSLETPLTPSQPRNQSRSCHYPSPASQASRVGFRMQGRESSVLVRRKEAWRKCDSQETGQPS
jgi:hypothetical protein